jgi:hypothetical protein
MIIPSGTWRIICQYKIQAAKGISAANYELEMKI